MRPPSIRRWLRTEEWWNSKPPIMVAVAYWQLGSGSAVEPVGSALPALALFLGATFGLAGFGYMLNDFGDRESDRASGAPNAFLAAGPTWGVIGLVGLVALAVLPWLWLPTSPLILALLGLEVVLFVAYVLPPLRLKNRGAAGLVADATYGYVLPLLVSLLVFADLADVDVSAWRTTIVVSWSLVLGFRQIIVHQLKDAGRDERAGTATFALRFGWTRTLFVLERMILPLEGLLFVALLVTIGRDEPTATLGFLAYAALVLLQRRRHDVRGPLTVRRLPVVSRVHLLGGDVMSAFQVRWLPLLLLGALTAREPEYAAVLVLHLAVFESGLERLWRYDVPSWRRARQPIYPA